MTEETNLTECSGEPIILTKEQQQDNFDILFETLVWVAQTQPERFDLSNWFSSDPKEDLIGELIYEEDDEKAAEAQDGLLKKLASKVIDAVDSWHDKAANREELGCGTAGCIVGYLPTIFPDLFEHKPYSQKIHYSVVPKADTIFAHQHYRDDSCYHEAKFIAGLCGSDVNTWRKYIYGSEGHAYSIYSTDEPDIHEVLGVLEGLYNSLYEEEPLAHRDPDNELFDKHWKRLKCLGKNTNCCDNVVMTERPEVTYPYVVRSGKNPEGYWIADRSSCCDAMVLWYDGVGETWRPQQGYEAQLPKDQVKCKLCDQPLIQAIPTLTDAACEPLEQGYAM